MTNRGLEAGNGAPRFPIFAEPRRQDRLALLVLVMHDRVADLPTARPCKRVLPVIEQLSAERDPASLPACGFVPNPVGPEPAASARALRATSPQC
jgi:hypothetical protein